MILRVKMIVTANPIEFLKHNINYLMNHSGRYSHFQFYKHFIDFHQSKQYKPIS
jgi:hypothetical protein